MTKNKNKSDVKYNISLAYRHNFFKHALKIEST